MRSPTAHSLALLRAEGMVVQVVERFNPYTVKRQDLFGFADILGLGTGSIVAVQTTSSSNLASRQRKTLECSGAGAWLAAGGKIQLHGWRKGGAKGKRKTWKVTRREVVLEGGVMVVRDMGSAA